MREKRWEVSSTERGGESSFGRKCGDVERTLENMYNVHMNDLRFEWDESKSKQNVRKHGVSFEEAQTVFGDDHAIRFFDPDHSDDEDRFIMLGVSFKLRILVVCHCYQESDSVIRLISARKATRQESAHYRR